MKYAGTRPFWLTNYGISSGLSIGLHVCLWRLDVHIGPWMLSFGQVPLYEMGGKKFAAGNSYHRKRKGSFRERGDGRAVC